MTRVRIGFVAERGIFDFWDVYVQGSPRVANECLIRGGVNNEIGIQLDHTEAGFLICAGESGRVECGISREPCNLHRTGVAKGNPS
jgi:hypothetical protein